MPTFLETINGQIDFLHKKIANVVLERKYDEINVIREEIRILEEKKLTINKVSELKILMNFLTGITKPDTDWDRTCESVWSGELGSRIENRVNQRVLIAIYEAIIELDRKISE